MSESEPRLEASLLVNNNVVATGWIILRDGKCARNEFQPKEKLSDSIPDGSILKIQGSTRQLQVLNFGVCKAMTFGGSPHFHFEFKDVS